jgi:hypothetical protein
LFYGWLVGQSVSPSINTTVKLHRVLTVAYDTQKQCSFGLFLSSET